MSTRRGPTTPVGPTTVGPVRSCVACRRRRPQAELLRLAIEDGTVVEDPRRRRSGRGAYVCPDAPCHAELSSRHLAALRRALRAPSASLAPTTSPDRGPRTAG